MAAERTRVTGPAREPRPVAAQAGDEAIIENPIVKSGGNSTPNAPPATHASCNAVSDRPNADERAASGMSVWMDASSAT